MRPFAPGKVPNKLSNEWFCIIRIIKWVIGEFATPIGGTVTVVDAVAVPPGPVAVNVYFVVFVGLTTLVPEGETAPMPWSIETVVAFVVVQVRVEVCPAVMVEGEAESFAVGIELCTVTVAVAVAVPLLPVAVNV